MLRTLQAVAPPVAMRDTGALTYCDAHSSCFKNALTLCVKRLMVQWLARCAGC